MTLNGFIGPNTGPQCLELFEYDQKTLGDRWARTESLMARTKTGWPARVTSLGISVCILATGPCGIQNSISIQVPEMNVSAKFTQDYVVPKFPGGCLSAEKS